MNKSESIAELLKNLSAFQGELENVEKDTKGHGYTYAKLGACIDAAKPLLAKYGLSVMQLMGDDGNGHATMKTVLGHSSGEYVSTTCVIPIAKLAGGGANNPAQIMGASVTYIRRYQFAAIIGLAQEDDDAASATKGSAQHLDEKPWYNAFDDEKNSIIASIKTGEHTSESVISFLEQSFKINKKVRDEILAIK